MPDQFAQDRNMLPDSRAEFEAWAKRAGWPHSFGYSNTDTLGFCLDSWEAWQAATQRQQERIEELLASEKVLLADIEGLNGWKNQVIKASIESYGPDAVRYKFSLTNRNTARNTFPKWMDGRWFAFTPAEDDAHIGHIARIKELEAQVQALSLDAGRWKTFISLPYAIRAEWACNLSLAPVLTQWIDQAAIDAAVESRKDQS